jgi:hypothetical protein|tara:strand:+ start:252 stop:371 length:120 start_codon:yes stop_codon:yes gene_type:complete
MANSLAINAFKKNSMISGVNAMKIFLVKKGEDVKMLYVC